MKAMDPKQENKLTLQISEKNWPLFIGAFDLNLKALQKLQTNLIKERQMKSANEMEPDIALMRKAIEALKPLKPQPLPLNRSRQ